MADYKREQQEIPEGILEKRQLDFYRMFLPMSDFRRAEHTCGGKGFGPERGVDAYFAERGFIHVTGIHRYPLKEFVMAWGNDHDRIVLLSHYLSICSSSRGAGIHISCVRGNDPNDSPVNRFLLHSSKHVGKVFPQDVRLLGVKQAGHRAGPNGSWLAHAPSLRVAKASS